jgi:hypothetical protein
MGGRWIRVTGEGPIVSTGETPEKPPGGRGDDDTPGPLSVSL